MRDRKKNKRKEKTVPVRFPQKQIEKKTELNHQQRQRPQTAPLQRVPLGSRYPWGLNLLSLDTAVGKEVTKEGRDGSGLGAREGLVVRDVLHVHALQVRILWRTETKKQRVDLILGATKYQLPRCANPHQSWGQASRLEDLLWLGRAGRDRVHTR